MTVWEYLKFASEMRGLDDSTFRSRMKKIIEVCGLAQSLGKDIGTLSHGYRQRVGLGQALIHNPPILILDEPTSDLDPNEKAEVVKYIREIGKDHTILLSTHNLSEVEQACARAIIVSKGRVVADGALDDIRAKSSGVHYRIVVDEKHTLKGDAPKEVAVKAVLEKLKGVVAIKDTPTDDRAHAFELSGERDGDLRADIFRLCVEQGWIVLELRRDAQSLEDVFRDLTRGDERLSRGLSSSDDEEEEEEETEEEDEEEEAGKRKKLRCPPRSSSPSASWLRTSTARSLTSSSACPRCSWASPSSSWGSTGRSTAPRCCRCSTTRRSAWAG
jgi:ABC-2 type transport system ATP-binding protein